MSVLEPWKHLLDEYVRWQDPLPWGRVQGLRIPLSDQFDAVQYLLEQGYIERAGLVREQWLSETYRATPLGVEVWGREVANARRRPPAADPIPRHSSAKRALAIGPRDVFDLSRVPWKWDRKAEQDEDCE